MSALEAIVKNAEEIAIQDVEEIIEEVIEEEQVDWMGPQEGYYQADLLEHQMVDYDDADGYQSFLPVRNGDAYFSLNLPDLLSKQHQITQESGNSVRVVSCFNKKCQRQVACNGYLYTIKGYVSDTQWNNWGCINDHCYGEIRTTPDFTEIRENNGHMENCPSPDELQIAIRIAVFDTRLLAEFTEIPLDGLYLATLEKIKAEYPEGSLIFPSLEVLKSTLEDHRHNKIYRKRFEMQKFRDKQKKMNMTPDEVLFAENSSGLIKFRRTKPFPISHCSECDEQFVSTNLPSQDQLAAHYMYAHDRRLTIERFEFKDINAFDQYMRELNCHSRFKMRRMGLADENMYYLCVHDDRLAKSGVGRASRLQNQSCHCTAFIRVFDWRIVSKREGARIMIDYCLEHQPHVYEPDLPYQSRQPRPNGTFVMPPGQPYQKDYIDYYTPDVFMRDLEDRRIRSQKLMLGDVGISTITIPEQRQTPTKRQLEAKTYLPPGRLKASFGARSLAPPLAAQIAAGSTQPYVDSYGEVESPSRQRQKQRQPIRTFQKADEPDPSEPSTSSDAPPPRIYITQKPYTRLTERQNFKDIYTFNSICKVEDTCLTLLNRLQSCQNARIGLGYREKISAILRNANSDLGLQDGSSAEELESSWVLQRPVRGRPRKRPRMDGEEDEDDDREMDIEDMEEEEMLKDDDDDQEKDIKNVQLVVHKETIEEPEREETVEPVPQDLTTRSGRSRKPPARLADD